MKKMLFLAALVLPTILFAQTVPDPFTITGHITNLKPSARAYLLYQLGANRVIDSAEITNGNFTFNGTVFYPENAYLVIDHTGQGIAKVGNTPDLLNFYLEKGIYTISGADSASKTQISGSSVNDENKDLQVQLKLIEAPIKKLFAEINAASPQKQQDPGFRNAMTARSKVLQNQQQTILKNFIFSHPDSYVSIYTINEMGPHSTDPTALESLFNGLTLAMRNSEPGKMLAKTIEQAKITGVGAIAPNFTQNDVNGNPVTLASFRGKYVLIDFWASWCGPCREENPNLVRIYQKYKNKNFTVLGVSLDRATGKNDWLNAIKTDHLDWTQVSDLNFWSNKVAVLYFIGQIPSNFLLDPNGKIIARDLRGADLENKLAEVLGKI